MPGRVGTSNARLKGCLYPAGYRYSRRALNKEGIGMGRIGPGGWRRGQQEPMSEFGGWATDLSLSSSIPSGPSWCGEMRYGP